MIKKIPERDWAFKVDVFKRKVQSHIDSGYNTEIAERKVLHDYHIYLDFNNLKWKRKKRQTDKNGFFINNEL